MGDITVLLHEEDDRILSGEFQFTDDMFELREKYVQNLGTNFYTPTEKINKDFENFTKFLSVGHLNASSVPKHRDDISCIVRDCGFDVFGTGETFIKEHTPKSVYNIDSYKFFQKNRDTAARGGIGIYVKEEIPAKKITLPSEPDQPELLFVELTIGTKKIAVGEIYKSPLIPYGVFAQLHETLAYITSKYEHTIIMGDFNINFLKPDSSAVKFFNTHVMEPFALTQLVESPTRVTKDTTTLIDLVLTGLPENVKMIGVVDVPGISDHSLVYFSYAIKKPKYKPKMVTRRDLSKFEEETFTRDISTVDWRELYSTENPSEKAEHFESTFSTILDKHAPFKTRRVTRPPAPWLTDEIKEKMQLRDRYKNKFNQQKQHHENKNDILETFNIYQGLRNTVTHMIRAAKKSMFNEKINSKIKNPKLFHSALKNYFVVDNKKASSGCNTINPTKLNDCFLSNNNANIDESKIDEEITNILKDSLPAAFRFHEVTETEVKKVIKSIKTNACGVDKISAYFLKMCIQQISKPIMDIVNSSFTKKIFPSRWKMAQVKPLPKINIPLTPSDFRPISLLPAISKIMEKLAAKQMVDHLKSKKLLDKYQSAYKQNHGTLTALLNITEDIYDALEESEVIFLVLLDYSKAFDTANHKLILAKLKKLGFHKEALDWIQSYLFGRSQQVCTDDKTSTWKEMINGVPQGSILGPLLFTILISDIKTVISNGRYHLYADDTQLYYRCKVDKISETINKINLDLDKISNFSERNCLKLNNDKSNYIIIGSHQNLSKISKIKLPTIKIKNEPIERKNHVKNLGIIFDETLSWEKHINNCIGKAYGKLKQTYRFKNFLSNEAKLNISEIYVLSQFNYCDSLFLNSSKLLKSKIQKVQNSCLRFCLNLRKFDHISEHRIKLGLLNMDQRRILHSTTLMRKIVKGIAPSYLSDRIKHHSDLHNHNTRNREALVLNKNKSSKKANSFFGTIPKQYNILLNKNTNILNVSITTFKKKCKQHLLNV